MKIKQYHKLVRDRIPQIITQQGNRCITQTLEADAYLQMVDQKLNEELAEYYENPCLEELADLLEVVYAAAKARGYAPEELDALREQKAEQRGRFDQRILLVEVQESQ